MKLNQVTLGLIRFVWSDPFGSGLHYFSRIFPESENSLHLLIAWIYPHTTFSCTKSESNPEIAKFLSCATIFRNSREFLRVAQLKYSSSPIVDTASGCCVRTAVQSWWPWWPSIVYNTFVKNHSDVFYLRKHVNNNGKCWITIRKLERVNPRGWRVRPLTMAVQVPIWRPDKICNKAKRLAQRKFINWSKRLLCTRGWRRAQR